MSDHSSKQPDISSQFQGLNMSAQPFVPSVHAPAFQPSGNYGQMYGGVPSYGMGGPPPPGMYGGMPSHMYHMQGYGMGGGYMHHGMPPYQQGRAPLHQMNPHSHVHPSDQRQPSPNRGGVIKLPQQYQPQHQTHTPVSEKTASQAPEVTNPVLQNDVVLSKKDKPQVVDSLPVDSWEDINVTEEATPKPQAPEIEASQTTKKTETPVVSKGMATSQTSSSDSPRPQEESCKSEKQHFERKPKENNGNNSEVAVPKSAKSVQSVQVPIKKEDEKENVNIVFIGHVDAGKSTIGGHLMYLTGQVDKRTLEKYEREAREKNRETWYLSWALDTNQEERDKGKTVEVGRASFETDKKRFTILDAPGHAGFVPNMISGTVQADIGILVISARRGEFETGFERRGQTREHAMLAKTAGVKHLVVLVNKMDDPTVCWSEERYEECKTKLTPFLKKVGFNPKTDINFIPVSGLTGANLKALASDVCTWYKGAAFLPYLENLPPIAREDEGPLRIPIADKYKDMGTMVIGKVESGSVGKGSTLIVMPNRTHVEVLSVIRVEEEVPAAYSGDNIKLKLKGVEEEDISPGFVLCSPQNVCHVGRVFDAQVVILEYKSIICAGFSCVLHIHSVVEEVEIINLIGRIDKKTGKKMPEKPKFIKQDHTAIARFQTSGIICMEAFKDFPPMARFTLRDEGKTIAIGKVLKILE